MFSLSTLGLLAFLYPVSVNIRARGVGMWGCRIPQDSQIVDLLSRPEIFS